MSPLKRFFERFLLAHSLSRKQKKSIKKFDPERFFVMAKKKGEKKMKKVPALVASAAVRRWQQRRKKILTCIGYFLLFFSHLELYKRRTILI